MLDESLVIKKAQKGDQKSLEFLIKKHQNRIRVYCSRFFYNISDVDDVTQNVFLTMCKGLEKYENDRSFSAWLFTIAKQESLYFLRSKKNAKKKHDAFMDSVTIDYLSEEDSLSQNEDDSLKLQECMQKLKPAQREIISLKYYEGKKSIEIADALQKKHSTIRISLMRIRQMLALCIKGEIAK